MRKLIALTVLLCSLPCFSQSDVRRTGQAIVTVLDRGRSWGDWSGSGLVYVMDTVNVNSGLCIVIVNNNTTAARNVQIGTAVTPDPYTTTYVGNSGRWVSSSGAIEYNVAASGSQSFFFNTFGAMHVAIALSGAGGVGGAPNTADIFAIQGTGCPNGATSTTPTQSSPAVTVSQNQWHILSAPGSGVQATVSNTGVPGVRHTAVCYAVDLLATTGTACSGVDAVIRDGACGTGTIIWDELMGATAANGAENHANLCGLQLVGTAGNAMCIEFKASSASCFQRVNLSGFDQ